MLTRFIVIETIALFVVTVVFASVVLLWVDLLSMNVLKYENKLWMMLRFAIILRASLDRLSVVSV